VGEVGEVHVVRLLLVHLPGDLFVLLDIVVDQLFLVGCAGQDLGVAQGTVLCARKACGIGALVLVGVAELALAGVLQVELVAEVDGLFFLDIEDLGENDPTHDESGGDP
jgi:hypothetical protein